MRRNDAAVLYPDERGLILLLIDVGFDDTLLLHRASFQIRFSNGPDKARARRADGDIMIRWKRRWQGRSLQNDLLQLRVRRQPQPSSLSLWRFVVRAPCLGV